LLQFWWEAGDLVSSYSERKSGFMKWFGKIFKIGSNRGRGGGRHLQQPEEENMAWRAPARSMVNKKHFLFCSIRDTVLFQEYQLLLLVCSCHSYKYDYCFAQN